MGDRTDRAPSSRSSSRQHLRAASILAGEDRLVAVFQIAEHRAARKTVCRDPFPRPLSGAAHLDEPACRLSARVAVGGDRRTTLTHLGEDPNDSLSLQGGRRAVVQQQPIEAQLLDRIGELLEIDRLAYVAIRAEAVSVHEIALLD
jgi:hypothetical protein